MTNDETWIEEGAGREIGTIEGGADQRIEEGAGREIGTKEDEVDREIGTIEEDKTTLMIIL